MKMGMLRYPAIAAVILGGAMIAAPSVTHAEYYVISSCAAGTTPTVVSGLQIQVRGATNFALSIPTPTMIPYGPFWAPVTTAATPMTSTAMDYGYAWYVAGLGLPFQPASYNEHTALFTFGSTTTAVDTSVMGSPSSNVRTGTLTMYAATALAGDWSNPMSFQSGTPILSASFSEGNYGTVTPGMWAGPGNTALTGQSGIGQDFFGYGSATVTSSTPFSLDGTCYQLGTVGSSFLIRTGGHLASPTSVNGAYSGVFASAGLMP